MMGRWVTTVSLLAVSIIAIGLAGPTSATDEITENAGYTW